MKHLLLLIPLLYAGIGAHAQQPADVSSNPVTVSGSVVSFPDKQPLAGVNVIVKGTTRGIVTDSKGRFSIHANPTDVLVFSFIGYQSSEITVGDQTTLDIVLEESIAMLQEINIYATGYGEVPKERATGSFVKVNNDLLSRRISADVISRIEDVTSGVVFNRTGPVGDPISIRGRSTLLGNARPLIIIDNFPYDGDWENINPNDVESITVLKDAAAASIWGARAGNGVIVITTKKGKNSSGPQVTMNSNMMLSEKPDAFFGSPMSVNDFTEAEKALFSKGFYTSTESSSIKAPLSPVVETLIAARDGLISGTEANDLIEQYKLQDIRKDYKYFYRPAVNQQYAINVSGGTSRNKYFISSGFDKSLSSSIGNEAGRFTLSSGNTWSLLPDKLELTGALYYTESAKNQNGVDPAAIRMSSTYPVVPYGRLADDDGNPLPVTYEYRAGFIQDAENKGLLNWQYRPLEETRMTDLTTKQNDHRINGSVRYTIIKGLRADILYQYWKNNTEDRDRYPLESYFTRSMINQYTQVQPDGTLIFPVPKGDILDVSNQISASHNARGQLNYERSWNKHVLHALAGYEIKDLQARGTGARYYGYNNALAISLPVDYISRYPRYYNPASTVQIPDRSSHSEITDRFVSAFINAGYTWDNRLTLTFSARKDQSNLFGVKANQKGVPLASAGAGWHISEESFYNVRWLPYVKLRATYGFNGNVNKNVTAYTTARINGTSFLNGKPYARVTNPPNPELQWERIKILNAAIDFESRESRINGTVELYYKYGLDLIGESPLAPSTGMVSFKGNTAGTKTRGVDITLNTKNINGSLRWDTQLLFSFVKERTTDYAIKSAVSRYLSSGDGSVNITPVPLEGRPLFAVYSYQWGGLEPRTGDPQGYLDGELSKDYSGIINNVTPETLQFNGPARPAAFGSLRNTFSWHGLELSFNIACRLGYSFRRPSVVYSNNMGLGTHSDYALRWQQPGDELYTSVPSIPQVSNNQRDNFYRYSGALVEKGDHIRLQDISLSYTLMRSGSSWLKIERIRFYAYANNLGLLWKATRAVPDPDYWKIQSLRTIALGLKIDF